MESALDSRTVEIAWRLVSVSQETVRTLEDSVTRVAATQAAGLIALWTQLHTFDEPVPEVLAWSALLVLVGSLLLLGWLATPQRLVKFWGAIPTRDVLQAAQPMTLEDEARLVGELREAITRQVFRLRLGLRVSVVLASFALVAVVVGYAIEKAERGAERPQGAWTFS